MFRALLPVCALIGVFGVPRETPRVPLTRQARHQGVGVLGWSASFEGFIGVDSDVAGVEGLFPLSLAAARSGLIDKFDYYYTIKLKVGTPSIDVDVVIDTGSGTLWLSSQSAYKPSRSSTMERFPNSSVSIKYVKGAVEGHTVEDRVCVSEALCIPHEPVVYVSSQTDMGGGMEGLVGLAFPATNADKHHTFLEELRSQSGGVFGLRLCPYGKDSFLTWGNFEEVAAAAPVGGPGVTLDVIPLKLPDAADKVPVFWLVHATLNSHTPVPTALILDSGTSLMGVDASYFHDVMEIILPAGHTCQVKNESTKTSSSLFTTCPCNTEIQPLTFTLTGNKASEGAQFKVTLTSDDLFMPMGMFQCLVKIQGLKLAPGLFLMGDVFLRKAYIVHDTNKLQVTFFPVPEPSATALALEQKTPADLATLMFLVATVASLLALAFKLRRGVWRAESTASACQDLEGVTEYNRL